MQHTQISLFVLKYEEVWKNKITERGEEAGGRKRDSVFIFNFQYRIAVVVPVVPRRKDLLVLNEPMGQESIYDENKKAQVKPCN